MKDGVIVNTKINIKNENLADYVMFRLDKIDNEFTSDELKQITEVVIDYCIYKNFSLSELLIFENLRMITIRNGYICNSDYTILFKLNNLNKIVFENCEFENTNLVASLPLKSLSLINCKIDNYSFVSIIKNLEELSIVNGIVELSKINMLKNLKYLQISYSNIVDNVELNINGLNELHIDNTNINNFSFLHHLTNLKKISIDENQYINNLKIFDNLMKKEILILNENMSEFGGESDEV